MSTLKVGTIQDHANSITAMTIDGSGRVLQPTKPAFRAYIGSSGWTTLTHNGHYIVPFNTEKHDIGSNYNTSTYRFTCPVDGLYYFSARAYMHSDGGTLRLSIITGTTSPATDESTFLSQTYRASNVSQRNGSLVTNTTAVLTANTQVGCYLRHDSDTNNSTYSENNTLYNHFEGYLIG